MSQPKPLLDDNPTSAEEAPPQVAEKTAVAPVEIETEAGAGRRPVRLSRAAFGAACISLQPMLLSAVMLPATAYVIRSLGPTAYGQWATATALIAVATVFTNLGLRGTFVRSIARDPASAGSAMAQQLGLRIGLAAASMALVLVACALLRYPKVVLLCTLVTSLGLVLTTVSTTASDLLQAMHRLPTVAVINLVAGLLLTGTSVAAAWLGGGAVGIAASYLVGPVVSTALLLWVVHRQFFPVRVKWDVRRFKALLWEARYLTTQLVVESGSRNAEALIVPWLVGPTMFGYFSAGALLANRLTTVPEGLCSAAYPAIVASHRRSPRAGLITFLKFLALVLAACIPAALAVTLVARPVSELLFPGKAAVAEQVMRITIWLLPVMGVQYMVGYALIAFDKDAENTKASLVGAAVSLVLTGLLVWKFGLIGACWSMVLRFAIHLVCLIPTTIHTFKPLLARGGGGAGDAAVPQVAV